MPGDKRLVFDVETGIIKFNESCMLTGNSTDRLELCINMLPGGGVKVHI